MYLVKVLVIATAFQDFAFIVKYYPFTFVAYSLSSISRKQKKILIVCGTYDYPKRCEKMAYVVSLVI